VLDAGHGGKDPGTVGKKKTNEKDITLAVVLKLGELISKKFPEIEVIYTRKKDVFVELNERGNIANRNNADLFISIHVDAVTNPKVRGASTWVMGLHKSEANFEVSRRENAVIELESDYTSKYGNFDLSPESYIIFSLMQNAHINESLKIAEIVQNEMVTNGPITGNRSVRQAGFLVLWKTAMPSILIELGFLSNPTEETVLTNKENQAKIAQNIFSAFCKYKEQYEKNNDAFVDQKTETIADKTGNNSATITDEIKKQPAENNIAAKDSATNIKPAASNKPQKTYSVQIMAITKAIPATAKNFKGHRGVKYMKAGKYYKYMIGNFSTLNEAKQLRQSLQKDFKGAFVVEIEGDSITPKY
jgi:N-acetylmuramoyl-L-alanine amidase